MKHDSTFQDGIHAKLIRDLLLFFSPTNVLDPMMGSGTCADVCSELGIPCLSRDIRQGFDATDADCFRGLPTDSTFDFVWAHPPYWRQKIYTSASRDLSRAPTLPAFLECYAAFITNCAGVLSLGGKFAILMGDYCDRDAGFVPLTYQTKQIAFAAGLRQCCTDIIRFSHGASSSRKVYRTSFIPGLHDVCMVFEKV
jgi:DNA modification methylase